MNEIFDIDGYPAITETGVRCGNHFRGDNIRHPNAATVRACYEHSADALAAYEEQYAAELAAESATERYFEDRGYWEARAQEDYEERHGVISFQDAYRMACPEAFGDMPVDA